MEHSHKYSWSAVGWAPLHWLHRPNHYRLYCSSAQSPQFGSLFRLWAKKKKDKSGDCINFGSWRFLCIDNGMLHQVSACSQESFFAEVAQFTPQVWICVSLAYAILEIKQETRNAVLIIEKRLSYNRWKFLPWSKERKACFRGFMERG